MESFNRNRFLRCFDQLADVDEERRIEAVNQLLSDLALPPAALNSTDKKNHRNGKEDSKDGDQYKNPLSEKRTYKFMYTVKSNNLLQYTLERLIRGLKADRKCSRVGFTVALSSVLTLHGENIQWQQVVTALLDYTSLKDCVPSELKDAMCGRLYGLFVLQRNGFFRMPQSLGELEHVFQSIWEAYDCKIYLQDAACVLMWLICRDLYRSTGDVSTAIKHVKDRLAKLLDADFIDKTLSDVNDQKRGKGTKGGVDDDNYVGKTLTGVLPCALFGLYCRLHEEMNKSGGKILKGTVLEKSPLDMDSFLLALRYVLCIPNNHPVIGSMFDVFVDYMLKGQNAEQQLVQLWNSINLNMIDLQAGYTPQRGFTALRLSSMLFLKVRNSPQLLSVLCKGGSNFFRVLCRYQKAPKGDVMKAVSRQVLQLLADVFQGVDEEPMMKRLENITNPAMNDYVVYAKMHKTLNEVVIPESIKIHKEDGDKKQKRNKKDKPTESLTLNGAADHGAHEKTDMQLLPENCVVDSLIAIAESVNYSASSLTVFHNLFGVIVRASEDMAKTYALLESHIANIDIVHDSQRLTWIFSMLQLCVVSSQKAMRIELFERLFATHAFTLPVPLDNKSTKVVSLGSFPHNSNKFRATIISSPPHYKVKRATVPNDAESGDSEDKVPVLSRNMLNSCFSLLSKTLNAIPSKKKDLMKQAPSRLNDTTSLLEVVNRLCQTAYFLTCECDKSTVTRMGSSDTIPIGLILRKCENKANAVKKERGKGSKDTVEYYPTQLAKKLMDCCLKLKGKVSETDSKMPLVLLYGCSLALMMLLLESQASHLSAFYTGDSAVPDSPTQIPAEKMAIVIAFGELFLKALETGKQQYDEIMKALMSNTLLETVLSDDNSAAFGLLHAISKGIWNASTAHITEDIRDKILQSALLDNDSYDHTTFQVDDAESESEEEDSDSEDHDVEEEDDDDESVDEDEDEESEEDENEESEDVDEEDEGSDSEEDGSQESASNKRQKKDHSQEESDEESDIELSGADVLDELIKDEEGQLEVLRMERLKLRMMEDLTPEALMFKLRNLDMLESCIPECKMDTWYINVISQLYCGYQAAVSAQGRQLDGNQRAVVSEYVRKCGSVLAEAIKHAKAHLTEQKVATAKDADTNGKEKGAASPKRMKFDDPDAALNSLRYMSTQIIEGQRSDKTAKSCRAHAVNSLLFALQAEPMITGAAPTQTRMVLLMALLSALSKNSKLGTNFFVQLANRNPLAFAHIDMITLALQSNVEFVQSELLSICAMVIDYASDENYQKIKRLCRRKSGTVIELIRSEDSGFTKEVPSKAQVVSYITDDFVACALKSLPTLLHRIQEKNAVTSDPSELNGNGKRQMKFRGISPLLAKRTARVITTLVKATPSTLPKKKAHLSEAKHGLEELLKAFDDSKGKTKQLQPLQSALARLSSALAE